MLVPGCRWIASTIARWPLNQLATLVSCTLSTTWPRSPRRTGAPSRNATTSEANPAASVSCPWLSTEYALSVPQSVPVGTFTLPFCTAVATSSMPILRAASCCGSSWIRTAYFCEPNTDTCATPSTVDSRWARKVSA